MTDTISERNGARILHCGQDGPVIGDGPDMVDLVGGAAYDRIDVVVLPVARLDPRFFTLSTGVAGEIAQKFVNYRVTLAIVGDITDHLERSTPLRDFVRETNRGRQLWFATDESELDARIDAAAR